MNEIHVFDLSGAGEKSKVFSPLGEYVGRRKDNDPEFVGPCKNDEDCQDLCKLLGFPAKVGSLCKNNPPPLPNDCYCDVWSWI